MGFFRFWKRTDRLPSYTVDLDDDEGNVLKVMADYFCWPLWTTGKDSDNIDPVDLSLSSELVDDLNAWAAVFDSVLNMEDPPSSEWLSGEALERFNEDGRALARRVACEVGDRFKVVFWAARGGGREAVTCE